jgi:hypothetical protein
VTDRDFLQPEKAVARGLCDKIVSIFSQVKLDFHWIIGQCYDGAGNTSSKYAGWQACIRELGEKVLYIWCQTHKLNLVVEPVLGSSAYVSGTLGLLQEVYNFSSMATEDMLL